MYHMYDHLLSQDNLLQRRNSPSVSLLLQELRAQDFALVRDGAVQFRPGLNAISGESGAGKSVLLGALLQLLGAPADADCVRHGADLAAVEGRWWLNSHMAQQVKHEMRKLMLPSKALPAAVGGVDDGGGGGYLHIKREVCVCDKSYCCFATCPVMTWQSLRWLSCSIHCC